MQSNFKSQQKPNRMSDRKCRAIFLTDIKRSLVQRVQIFCLPLIWCEKAIFVLLAQITRKWMKLYKPLLLLHQLLETHSTRCFVTNEKCNKSYFWW